MIDLKINSVVKIIFDEHQDYEEVISIINDEKIKLLDGVDVEDNTLEGAILTVALLEGASLADVNMDGLDVINCTFDL